jgi:hypothetical protein
MNRQTFKKLIIAYVITLAVAWGVLATLFLTIGPPDIGAAVGIPVAIALLLAFLFLMIGIGIFVFQDARQRGMEAIPWTIVAVLVPYFIGFIAYLLVRRPLQVTCPSCGAKVLAEAIYCHQCGKEMRFLCTSCQKPIGKDARFCAHCGTSTEAPDAESTNSNS